jgi:hypothetical protein
MKKINLTQMHFRAFALSCFLLSAFSLYAQKPQMPDSSFETGWKERTGHYGPYTDYQTEFFYTLNSLYALKNDQSPADLTAFKDGVNAQHGQYSIKLVSGVVPVGSNVFLPGMVGTLSQEFVDEYLDPDREVIIWSDWYGYDTPSALEGWYKYKPVNGDSALLEIAFYEWDTEVFVEKIIVKQEVANWTPFSIKIQEKYWNREFSDIRILFVASAAVDFSELSNCKGQKGSTLWIDNIKLTYGGNDIQQNCLSTLKANIFPNPAIEVINVELNEPFAGNVVVYDLSGRKIMEENINGTQSQLNISALATGNYIYKLMNENTIFAQGKFVVTK